MDDLIARQDEAFENTLLVYNARCQCRHSITNHLGGHCDVCPCDRAAGDMAIKVTNIGDDRG